MPKFAVLVSASAESEASQTPDVDEFAAMGAFNDSLRAAGVLVVAEGFVASKQDAARINFSASGPSEPVPGPFGLDNLVAGFWLWELESLEQAVEWAKKIPFKEGRVEIRRVAGKEDWGSEFVEELRKKGRELRDD